MPPQRDKVGAGVNVGVLYLLLAAVIGGLLGLWPISEVHVSGIGRASSTASLSPAQIQVGRAASLTIHDRSC
jgi:hypothetical protein